MSTHDWTQQNLDAYLAGGLSPDEKRDIDEHLAGCEECAQTLADTRKLEHTMDDLFGNARPDAGLEKRAIAGVRQARFKRATMFRFVGAVAAVLVLGLAGAAMQAIAVDAPFPGGFAGGSAKATNELVMLDDSRSAGRFISGLTASGEMTSDLDIQFDASRIDNISVEGRAYAKEELGIHGKLGGDSFARQGEGKGKEKNKDKELDAIDGRPKGEPPSAFTPPLLPAQQNEVTARITREQKAIEDVLEAKLGKRLSDLKITELGDLDHKRFLLRDEMSKKESKGEDGLFLYAPDKALGLRAKMKPAASELADNYMLRVTSKFSKDPAKTPPPGDPREAPKKDDAGKKEREGKKDEKLPDGGARPKADPEPQPEHPPAVDPNLKIIRIGEMEFEVDSYYGAVRTINTLLAKYKGSFRQKQDSKQQENGKIRGYVVVRIPPQFLDRFVDDLRGDKAMGELKTQHIGSQDVTTQYTDMEGELRAAKAFETRLINIIKDGKGDLKDLVVAERELATNRAKIERFEGQKRSYDDRISLSTLTINLVEKEFQAASMLVVTDHVQMRVEVDDVIDAHKKARDLVEAIKGGRVTKSDLKTLKAGQIEGILQAEVPPAEKTKLRKALEKLGLLSEHEETQTQRTEGGTGRLVDLKTKISDVVFELTLHNIANVQPKNTTNQQIASSDVPGWFAKLQAEIKAADGQIRNAKLNEQDKLNITAEIAFNVPIAKKEAIDETLAKIGARLSRNNVQAAVTEISTERKHGYHVLLRDIANIPPRETFHIQIATHDVSSAFRELQEFVKDGIKGLVLTGQLIEDNKVNIAAKIDFDVSDKDHNATEKQIKILGAVLTRTNVQVPVNETATDQKIGYRVILRAVATLLPRETVKLTIEAKDVDKMVGEFKETALAGKGRVVDANVSRHENGQVTAFLVLDVPIAVQDVIVLRIKNAGNLVSQQSSRNPQAQDHALATARIEVTLQGVYAGKQPRETVTMSMEVADVDEKSAELKKIARGVKGRVADEKAGRKNTGQVTADLIFEVPLAALEESVQKFRAVGNVLTYDAKRNPQVPDNELATARIEVSLGGPYAGKPAREKVRLTVEAGEIDKVSAEAKEFVRSLKGRAAGGNVERLPNGQARTVLTFTVPLSAQDALVKQLRGAGKELQSKTETDPNVPDNDLATAQVTVTLQTPAPIVASDEGISSYLKTGLSWSFKIFAYCMIALITGVALLVPVGLLGFGGYVATRWIWPGEDADYKEPATPEEAPAPAETPPADGSDKAPKP